MHDGFVMKPVTFTLNGREVQARPMPGERLSDTLRERLATRDVKVGCNAGDCGACTVLVDGEAVCACLTPTRQVAGSTVDSLSGLVARDATARVLAAAFLDHGAAQCGICTPGMIVSAVCLLRDVDSPSESDIEDALGGVLCRCTGYRKIIDAVIQASRTTVSGESVSGQVNGHGWAGTSVQRIDGPEKVEGRDLFGDDIAPPDSLVLKLVRSPFARARFTFGDLDTYVETHPGAVAVLIAADIPGVNRFGVIPWIRRPAGLRGSRDPVSWRSRCGGGR